MINEQCDCFFVSQVLFYRRQGIPFIITGHDGFTKVSRGAFKKKANLVSSPMLTIVSQQFAECWKDHGTQQLAVKQFLSDVGHIKIPVADQRREVCRLYILVIGKS